MSTKILVVSDSHRRDANLLLVIDNCAPIDMLIHLGDAEGSHEMIREFAGNQCTCYFVEGNNDFFSHLDREKEISLGSHRALLSHGHYYNVSLGAELYAQEAKSRGCDIAMFGHTHRPFLKKMDGVTVLNPGSISYPRQDGHKPSYMIIEIDDQGEIHYTQNYL